MIRKFFKSICVTALTLAIESTVHKLLDKLEYCRHVMDRGVQVDPQNESSPETWHLRCGEPADPGCRFRHCVQHCLEMCGGVDDDPDDPDEDEIEPDYEPPVMEEKPNVLEAN